MPSSNTIGNRRKAWPWPIAENATRRFQWGGWIAPPVTKRERGGAFTRIPAAQGIPFFHVFLLLMESSVVMRGLDPRIHLF
jgi:hypothetical protein